MTFDTTVPPKLKRIQTWFGSIISRAIDEDSKMNPISPSGQQMELEACDYIRPSPTLRPAQRIQIYNQQYWWRLLNTLQETFPILTCIFGYHDFNRTLAIPYMQKYPPRHWSLAFLGDRFSQWIDDSYDANDKKLVLDAAKLDWAFSEAFICSEHPAISSDTLQKGETPVHLMNQILLLQPHVHLFVWDYDLLDFRKKLMKQKPQYWVDNDFPNLKKEKKYYYVLYRTCHNDVAWDEILEGEWKLLDLFKNGNSIDKACEWIYDQEETIVKQAEEKLPEGDARTRSTALEGARRQRRARRRGVHYRGRSVQR